ncbi:MAG: hypothetical protein CMC81_00275 [Flavobacteriaceae bacterium]|nr:hypothetical protein [Flavobacteriaceae bacterium]
MKNKSFLLIFSLLINLNVYCQGFIPMFNEYLSENLYFIHPAMVGVNLSGTRIQFGNRQQWIDIQDAPGTKLLTLEYKAKANSIFGVQMIDDHNGYHSKNSVFITYGYRIYLNNQIWNTKRSYPTKNDNIKELSFGLSLGSVKYNLDQSSFDLRLIDPLLDNNSSQERYLTFDAGIAYVSTHLSSQFSIKNLTLNPSNKNNEDLNIFDSNNFKHYLFSSQYEMYFDNGWNLEPSFLIQYLEKTDERSFDYNLKVYRIIPDGRVWLGISYRRNSVGISYERNGSIKNQYYKHITPIVGLNYKNYVVSYHYTLNLGEQDIGLLGLHYFTLGITL